MKSSPLLIVASALLATIPSLTQAAVITESSSAPVSSLISQPNFGGPLDGGKDYSDNWGTPGQTFTTGAQNLNVTAITIKGANSYGGFDLARYFVLSISAAAGTTSGAMTRVAQEASQAFVPGAGDTYLTITLSTPVLLLANTIYEFDIFTTDNSDPNFYSNPSIPAGSRNGGYYGFANSSSDVYAGGAAMQNGFQDINKRYSADPGSVNTAQSVDRTFFIQGTAVPEPSACLLFACSGMAGLFLRRRRTNA